jgi:hypothetical protein
MTTEMTVDQFLATQNEPLATIESIDGKPDLVKVTPWLESVGCLCTLSLVFPKNVIASINPTGGIHHCCGKRLLIVKVTFEKDAQVAVADVFAQAASSARVQRMQPRRVKVAADPCDGCSYNGQVYSLGSLVCMGNRLRECSGGDGAPYVWFDAGSC